MVWLFAGALTYPIICWIIMRSFFEDVEFKHIIVFSIGLVVISLLITGFILISDNNARSSGYLLRSYPLNKCLFFIKSHFEGFFHLYLFISIFVEVLLISLFLVYKVSEDSHGDYNWVFFIIVFLIGLLVTIILMLAIGFSTLGIMKLFNLSVDWESYKFLLFDLHLTDRWRSIFPYLPVIFISCYVILIPLFAFLFGVVVREVNSPSEEAKTLVAIKRTPSKKALTPSTINRGSSGGINKTSKQCHLGGECIFGTNFYLRINGCDDPYPACPRWHKIISMLSD